MSSQLWWHLTRAAGMVAWALLAASVLWGLALSTKVFGGHPRPAWLLDLHRFLSGAALVFIGLHVVTIYLDTYVSFGPLELFVPFTGKWHPMAVAWGIIAMYAVVAVEVTSLVRTRIPKRVWRGAHYLAFPLFVLTTVHGLSAGTDRRTFALRAAAIVVAGAVTVLTVIRATRADHHDLMTSPGGRPARRARADGR